MADQTLLEALRYEAHPLHSDDRFSFLLDQIGDASIVLLGEATHGTREFYQARAEISARLIKEKGFDAITVEADWPDALRASRYVQHASEDRNANEALLGFQRFPQWMWRNEEMLTMLDWLRAHNARIEQHERRVGFFGLDLYSLRNSMDAVVRYLEQVDPGAAKRARARYGCFDHLAEDPQHYGYATTFGLTRDCEDEAVRQLVAMTAESGQYLSHDGPAAADELFYAQQNALVVKNAEAYYRAMFRGRDESWNLRDTHMAETLAALRRHIGKRTGDTAKIVVWAHNSHLGDARATEMGEHGQINLGQLVRENHPPQETFLTGFTTHDGTVTAASNWDGPAERKEIRPSRPDSYERLFHDSGLINFVLPLRGRSGGPLASLGRPRLERAIGVIYLPQSERVSHYFHADLLRQFDAVVHIDRTTAIRPLERSAYWTHEKEVPETYPSGI